MASSQDSVTDFTTFDKILQPLKAPLQAIEAGRNVHHREVLSFPAFVRLLVYYLTTALGSGRQLLTATLSAAPQLGLTAVKHATFFDAFQRFPVEWFVTLLGALLASVVWKAIPELEALGKLYCVDGSLFPALATMLWAEYQSRCNTVRLHLVFELNRMVAVQFIVDQGNSNEKSALRQMLEAGVTYILDRGYVSFRRSAAGRPAAKCAAHLQRHQRPHSAADRGQRKAALSAGDLPRGEGAVSDPDQPAGLDHLSDHLAVRLPLAGGVDLPLPEAHLDKNGRRGPEDIALATGRGAFSLHDSVTLALSGQY
jgi:hypothetical protein